MLRSAWSRCQLLERRLRYEELAVDVDALPMPVHGHQQGVEYNGYFHASGFHPLIIGSAQTGDFFGAVLRSGNVHAHEGAEAAILERLDWIQSHLAGRVLLRFDAASVSGPLSEPAGSAGQHLVRVAHQEECAPRGAGSSVCGSLSAGAGAAPGAAARRGLSLSRAALSSQVLAAAPTGGIGIGPFRNGGVAHRPPLFPDHRPQSQTMRGRDVAAFYRQRGLFERMLGELNSTLQPQLSSTTRRKQHYRGRPPGQRTPSRDAFAANQAILTLNLLAYNLLHLGRQVAERAEARRGRPRKYGRSQAALSLDSFRRRYLRLPSRVTLHGRRVGVILTQGTAAPWDRLWRFLATLRPVDMGMA